MPDDQHGQRQWIVEPPPATSEIALYLGCGEGAELTEDQEQALSDLLRSLAEADVVGFETACNDCVKLKCTKVECSILNCTLNKVIASGPGWNLTGSFGRAPL